MKETLNPNFHVREIPIYGDRILAPMDGYSDWPFRSICRALEQIMKQNIINPKINLGRR